uniref:Quinolinate synthase n=1 Tax=uncultured marine group II/III euryarchaeote KM3_109_G01 TaxID=1457850 RepID=A0A075G5S0_9EURY|nr:quinolinate synthetase (nadA) [uncultured marine group II/III euryarchaeote KM3_109_G01]
MSLGLPLTSSPPGQLMEESVDAIRARIAAAKNELGQRLMILGHHYQRDTIIEHADATGDSFLLSAQAAASDAELIVFCGVHFMAESADILTRPDQTVMMPNVRAGCSMADMANLSDVEECWYELLEMTRLGDPVDRVDSDSPAEAGQSYLIPVTYMNSAADLKAFVGEHGGIVCTSSNAAGVLDWAWERAGEHGKVLFFPDQHLGRNTGLAMGLEEQQMVVWTPGEEICEQSVENSRLILWHGYCSVHARFTTQQIDELRSSAPEALIVVHPECSREVVESSDAVGSTEFIRTFCADAAAGSIIGIGTEIHLVRRLDELYPDKQIICLDPLVCPCSTMYMIHPSTLADLLEALVAGEARNVVSIDDTTAALARLGLDRMLSILR